MFKIKSDTALSLGVLTASLILAVALWRAYASAKWLWIDEGYSTVTALRIAETGLPLFPSWFWDGSYLFFHYLQAGAIRVAGSSEAVLRLVPALLGGIGAWLSYLVARRIYGTPAGLLAAGALALSVPYWTYMIQGRYYAALVCAMLAGLLCVLRFVESPTRGRFFAALAAGLAGTLLHVYCALVLGLLAVALAMALRKFPSIRPAWSAIGLGTLCLAVFALLRETIFVNPWSASESLAMNFAHIQPHYLGQYLRFLAREFGPLHIFAFVAPVMGWFAFRDRRESVLLLSFAYFGGLLGVSFLVMFYAERYLIFLVPLLLVLSVGTLGGLVSRAFPRPLPLSAASVIVMALVVFSSHTFAVPPAVLPMRDTYSPEPDFRSAYAALSADARDRGGWCVASAFPAMDRIYLGRSDGYVYIDETGLGIEPSRSFYVRDGKNVFTGAPVVDSIASLTALPCRSRYVLVENISAMRLATSQSDILPDLAAHWRLVGEWKNGPYFMRLYSDSPAPPAK